MVIFRIRNQRNGRAFIGAVPDPTTIMDYDFPASLKEDMKEYSFSTQILGEYNSKETIKRKIANLLEKEINPYNNDSEESPKEVIVAEYPQVEEEIIFEAPLDDIEEYDIG